VFFFKKRHPKVNEKWVLSDDRNDPFIPKTYPPVIILEVKDGWVRYDMQGLFRDQRMEIKSFIRIFKAL
jgi:hypothetical protein